MLALGDGQDIHKISGFQMNLALLGEGKGQGDINRNRVTNVSMEIGGW